MGLIIQNIEIFWIKNIEISNFDTLHPAVSDSDWHPQCLTLTDTRCVDPSYNYSPPQSHYLLPGVIIEEIWGPAHPPAGHVTESGREGGAEYLQYYIIPVLQYYIIPVYYCILN